MSFDFKAGLTVIVLFIICLYGYIANIVWLATGFEGLSDFSGFMILRVFGLVLVPIGIVMGFIPN